MPEEDLKSQGDDDYYYFQLIGCTVVTESGARIGRVKAIQAIQGNELLVVERGDAEVYIPFAESICRRIDLGSGVIVVDPPEGLLDLNEI